MIRAIIQSTIHNVHPNNNAYSQGQVTTNAWWAQDGHWYLTATDCDPHWGIVDNKHWLGQKETPANYITIQQVRIVCRNSLGRGRWPLVNVAPTRRPPSLYLEAATRLEETDQNQVTATKLRPPASSAASWSKSRLN